MHSEFLLFLLWMTLKWFKVPLVWWPIGLITSSGNICLFLTILFFNFTFKHYSVTCTENIRGVVSLLYFSCGHSWLQTVLLFRDLYPPLQTSAYRGVWNVEAVDNNSVLGITGTCIHFFLIQGITTASIVQIWIAHLSILWYSYLGFAA